MTKIIKIFIMNLSSYRLYAEIVMQFISEEIVQTMIGRKITIIS